MKIKYIAAATAATFMIGSAAAADVEIYGLIDAGIGYNHTSARDGGNNDDFEVTSGVHSGSRVGLKGYEDLNGTTKIGFQLEQGFNIDSGEFADSDRAFSRESRVYVANDTYGEIALGRVGAIDSGNGTYGFMSAVSPFETGWHTIGSPEVVLYGMSRGRYDNTITYKSPELTGWTFYAQYSTDTDQSLGGDESSTKVNRYGAFGAKGMIGPVETGVTFAITQYGETDLSNQADDNGFAGTIYAKYDYNGIVPSLAVQIFRSAQQSRFDSDGNPIAITQEDAGLDGVGVVGAVTAPAWGGTMKGQLGYRYAEYSETNFANGDHGSWNLMQAAVGYEYPLSKRTTVYTGAGYTFEEQHGTWKDDEHNIEVVAGIMHKF